MKLAHIGVKDHGEVVTLEYADADADAPDLSGLMHELAPEVVAKMGYGHKPLIYKDSHGVWDEVVLHAGEFAGFRSLGVVQDRDEAIKRVLELRAMISQAADDETARTAIAALTIFKDKDGQPTPVAEDGSGPMSEGDLLDRLAGGLQAVVLAKTQDALTEILKAVLSSVPANKRDETFEVLDKVRKGYGELVDRMMPKVGDLVRAMYPAKRDDVSKAAEEAKNASKH
jgi:hypothetical protein